jgi:RNA 3'-terminal phosphate cyclase (ATP)
MIEIDGGEGEGGGQVLRNALALSLVTGQPFRIFNIRAKRQRPGLMRQHLTAVEAACQIGQGSCDGAAVGSPEITFRPGNIKAGDYHFAIGTAGSTGLVLQTILMPLLFADGPSHVVLEGGTHNPASPPFEFLARTFLPLVNRMGPKIEIRLVRHGFYPVGGGCIEMDITPAPLKPVEFVERGALSKCSASAFVAALPYDIGKREIDVARKVLDWPEDAFSVEVLPQELGPGNILLAQAEYEHVTEVVSGFGKMGVSAESLGKTAAQRLSGYMGTEAFAGPYLADQLLLPMALAGRGRFTTVKPSEHTKTAARVIERLLQRRIVTEQLPHGPHEVRIL